MKIRAIPIALLVLGLSSQLEAKKDDIFVPLTPLEALKSLGLSKRVREDEDRLAAIINEVTKTAKQRPLFKGARAVEATAMIYLGIAFHESGLKHDVESCAERGDHGAAYGLPQLHKEHFTTHDREYDVGEVCGHREVQWWLQSILLQNIKRFCKSTDPEFIDHGPEVWFGAYHSGNCIISGTSLFHFINFNHLIKKMGITVYRSGKEWYARDIYRHKE
jgi:hypothetical protein